MINAALIAAGLYLVYGLTLFGTQRAMIFPGQNLVPVLAADAPLPAGYNRQWLELEGGPVESWFVRAPDADDTPRATLIVAHGNYELMEQLAPVLEPLREHINLLLVEYPGYGRSAGEPSQDSIREAMLAAYDSLLGTPGVDPERIIAYGRSLGGGAACELAKHRPLAGLVLHSTFSSLRVFARGYGLPGMLVRDPFDNRSVVAELTVPILLLHGSEDEAIPVTHAQALAAANAEAQLITWSCGHNDCPPTVQELQAVLLTFLDEAQLLRPAQPPLVP